MIEMLEQHHLDIFYFPNGFPADDLQEVFRRIRCQSKTSHHAILRDFLDLATSSTSRLAHCAKSFAGFRGV